MERDEDVLLGDETLVFRLCKEFQILGYTIEAASQYGVQLLFDLSEINSDCVNFFSLDTTEPFGPVAKHSSYLSGDGLFFISAQAVAELAQNYSHIVAKLGYQVSKYDLILVTAPPGHQQYPDRILEHEASSPSRLKDVNACLDRLEANLSSMIVSKSSFNVILRRRDSMKDNHLPLVNLRDYHRTTYSSIKGAVYLRPGQGFFRPLWHGPSLAPILLDLFRIARDNTPGRMGMIEHAWPHIPVGIEHPNMHAQAASVPEFVHSVPSNETPNQQPMIYSLGKTDARMPPYVARNGQYTKTASKSSERFPTFAQDVNMYGFTHARPFAPVTATPASLYQLLRQARETFNSHHASLSSAEIDRLWQQEWSDITSQIDSSHPASIAALLPYQPKDRPAPASMTSPEADSPWSETDGLPPPYALSPGLYHLRLEAATRRSPPQS